MRYPPNQYVVIDSETVEIKMKRGAVKVDIEDLSILIKYRWYSTVQGYACTAINNDHILMHRLITKAKKGKTVDHINGDGLDNRKRNLRVCSRTINNLNTAKRKNAHFHAFSGLWMGRFVIYGKQIVKYFKTRDEAVKWAAHEKRKAIIGLVLEGERK